MKSRMTCALGVAALLTLAWCRVSSAQAFILADVLGLTTNAVMSGNLNMGEVSNASGLFLIPYYLRIQFPSPNYTAWGIQLYTDNNEQSSFVDPNGLFGGLRGRVDPLKRLPLYWQVYAEPQTNTTTAGGLGFYPATMLYWGRVLDRQDTDVVTNWMASHVLMSRTLAGYQGLGPYPLQGRTATTPPVYVYLGMDVGSVTQTQQFGTTLHLDLYNLGASITQAGYATPNPFTPATGQRTRFNFMLRELDSPFVIKIYTLRGRLVRVIRDSRDWDGRNDSGNLLEGGVYIYQVEAEGQRVSGTIVLIK